MNIQQHTGFYIAGLTARTNNAHEMSGEGKIGNVWHRFLQPNLVAKIPSKIGGPPRIKKRLRDLRSARRRSRQRPDWRLRGSSL